MNTNNITISTDNIDMEQFNIVAQGHIAECIMGGRNTVNVAAMLKGEDFEPLETAMDQLTEEFGSKSEKGSPRAKLYSRVAEYAKTDKSRTDYTFKKTNDGYKVTVKQPKQLSNKQVSQSSSTLFNKVVTMADNAHLSKEERKGLVRELSDLLGVTKPTVELKAVS